MPRRSSAVRARPIRACGCFTRTGARARNAPPGPRAAGVDLAIKSRNRAHLRRIEGQIRGIAAMIEDGRCCADIITQIAAVRESLHAVARNLLRNHLTHCAAGSRRSSADGRSPIVEELLELVGRVTR